MKQSSSLPFDPAALRDTLASLSAIAIGALEAASLRRQEIDAAAHDAAAWLHRRAARSAVDRAKYLCGAAWEPGGHLTEIDDLVLGGLDALGPTAVILLGALLQRYPGDTLSNAIVRLQRTPAGRLVRAVGVWARRVWLNDEYTATVVAFETSQAALDPKARWRSAPPTLRQTHLSRQLARMAEIVCPTFATSGEAHDWLLRQGGRFDILRPPPRPPVPTVAELLS